MAEIQLHEIFYFLSNTYLLWKSVWLQRSEVYSALAPSEEGLPPGTASRSQGTCQPHPPGPVGGGRAATGPPRAPVLLRRAAPNGGRRVVRVHGAEVQEADGARMEWGALARGAGGGGNRFHPLLAVLNVVVIVLFEKYQNQ